MSLPKLFTPIRVGAIDLANRVVMAPLTRNRARPDGDVPHALNVEYYRQRASAGLLITEATQISPEGKGYAFTPGIYSAEQIAGWTAVTKAVHEAGGRIVLQMWHVGRISHTSLQPNGQPPVAPSAIAAGGKTFDGTGFRRYLGAPRAGNRRDRADRGRLCPSHTQRPRGGVRRGRDSRGQRLSDRPVPE